MKVVDGPGRSALSRSSAIRKCSDVSGPSGYESMVAGTAVIWGERGGDTGPALVDAFARGGMSARGGEGSTLSKG